MSESSPEAETKPLQTSEMTHDENSWQKQNLYKVNKRRSIQENTKIFYDVFDNNITSIKELEKLEMENSGIPSHEILENREKNIQEVIARIELQLICLETEMKTLLQEVTRQAKKDLVRQTLKWAASREAADIPYGDVDHYCTIVLEILLFGARKELPNVDRGTNSRPTTAEQLNQAFYQVAKVLVKKEDKFTADQVAEAIRVMTLQRNLGKDEEKDIRQGAKRLVKRSTSLVDALKEYVPDL